MKRTRKSPSAITLNVAIFSGWNFGFLKFHTIKNFLVELKSFYKFYFEAGKDERDVVFYSEDKGSYGYFEGLLKELADVKNTPVSYVTSDISDPILRQDKKNIKAFYINSLLPFFILFMDSKLLIMTMPDLHRFHIRRSIRGTHHLYLFHNIGSSFSVNRFGAIFYYDTIFCSGPHHREEIRKQEEIYRLPKKNLVNFGYYKIEKAYNAYKDYTQHSHEEKNRDAEYKAHVLIGPSWGDNSILNFCGEELIRILLASNYKVTVRPHPMTYIKTPRILDNLDGKFKNFTDYERERDITSMNSIYSADILISDWSGLAFEYAFSTERPVLFIDVPQKIVNPRYREVGIEPMEVGIRYRIGMVLKIGELEKTDSVISHMLENRDSYTAEIRRARTECVYNFGLSSRAGADYIMGFLRDRVGNTVKNIDVR